MLQWKANNSIAFIHGLQTKKNTITNMLLTWFSSSDTKNKQIKHYYNAELLLLYLQVYSHLLQNMWKQHITSTL